MKPAVNLCVLVWLVICFSGHGAATRIGNESAVTTPASARYSTTVNVRPGDGETVTNNPPIFSWFYNTNHLTGGNEALYGTAGSVMNRTNAFQFQVATQANFGGTLALDINTPFNFYNFLAPFSTNATRQFWWRVKYVTNGVAWWTNGIYTFTVAGGATNWDRGMFSDSGYYATNCVHPFFLYRAGEESAVWAYAQTNDARIFLDLTNAATAATNASYWKDATLWATNTQPIPKLSVDATDGNGRANQIFGVMFMHRFSGDNRWTNSEVLGNIITNLYHLSDWWNNPSNNYAMDDYGDSESAMGLRCIVAGYDWFYSLLGGDTGTFAGQTRTNLLQSMRLTARFHIYNYLWTAAATPPGTQVFYFDWNYANRTNYCVQGGSETKQDNSHGALTRQIINIVGWVGGEEDMECKLFREYMLNYFLMRASGFAGWAAHHIGVYGYVDNHIYNRQLQLALMSLHVSFPQLQLQRTDFATRFPEWYTRLIPFGKRMYHGPYGDGLPAGNASYFVGIKNRGWDLASFTGSGLARQLYELSHPVSSNTFWEVTSHADQIPVRYHFPIPAPTTNTTSAVYPEDGFVIASSKSPSEFDSYTNGAGFSFKAAPRGNYQNHMAADALSFDLWAYGAQITDGGGDSLNPYGYRSESAPGLFINGYGMTGAGIALYAYSQANPLESQIIYYTNGTTYVYTAADGTALWTNRYNALSNIVVSVRRDILFVTNTAPYWVVYDSFSTSSNSTFGFRWHVPWAFRYQSGGSPLANETEFTGSRFGSNSLVLTATGFTYDAGNYADSAYPDPQRCRVQVHFVTTNQGIFVATGTNHLGVTTNNAIGSFSTNSTLNPFRDGGKTYATVNPDRAAGIWLTNTVAATNWHFMTVIAPVPPGAADWTITTITENTVRVQRGAYDEGISWGETNALSTIIVDTLVVGANPTPELMPTGLRAPWRSRL